MVLQAALASDSKGYVCALSSLQDAPVHTLRRLWANASPEVIVRLLCIGHEPLDSAENVPSIMLGDLFVPGNVRVSAENKATLRLVDEY